MNVVDPVQGFTDVCADNPLVLLFVLVGLGSAIGAVRFRSFSLGPAAVLFVALAFSAYDERLKLPVVIGQLGLVLFAYTIGVAAGPSFFATVRSGGRSVALVVGLLVLAAATTLGVGHLLGLSGPVLSGVYAGSLTNTPALAASIEQLSSAEPTVGYSVTYLFGVLGMLLAAGVSLRTTRRASVGSTHGDGRGPGPDDGSDEVPRLDQRTLRVDVEGLPTLVALAARYEHKVVFSRVMRGDAPGHPGRLDVASDDVTPVVGDILTVVGDTEVVERVVRDLGHPSTVPLVLDRSRLDFRRITVSKRDVAGRSLEHLALTRRFGATATRVRRGDVDLLATDDLVIQLGDRVRVVARREAMPDVAAFLGDSERGASDLNPVGLALGLSLGLLIGLVTVPMPGGGKLCAWRRRRSAPGRAGARSAPTDRTGAVDDPLPGLVGGEPARHAALPGLRRLDRGPRAVRGDGLGPGHPAARRWPRGDGADGDAHGAGRPPPRGCARPSAGWSGGGVGHAARGSGLRERALRC